MSSNIKLINNRLTNSSIIEGHGNIIIQKLNNKKDDYELESIIDNITDNLSGFDEDEAEQIIDIIDMASNELQKSEPKVSRLENCLSLIASMVTVVNGVPDLVNNLQRLADYILLHLNR